MTMMASALLALWGALATLVADSLPDTNFSLLPPVNLTVQVTGIAQVLLHWVPDPAQEDRGAALGYHVRVRAPPQQDVEDLETPDTQSFHEAALHLGLSVCVRTVLWAHNASLPTSRWVVANLEAPPGAPGSSAVNLTCRTVVWAERDPHPGPSSLRIALQCSWGPGPDSPAGLQYFLRYRYRDLTQECHNYEQDAQGRNVGCSVPRMPIGPRARGQLAVQVRGSSPRAAVRPWEQLFDLQAMDRVNPPGNLTASVDGYQLSVRWEKPLSFLPDHCFHYEVQVLSLRTERLQTEKLRVPTFTSRTDGASQYSVRVRAAVSSFCRPVGAWGAWSQPVLVGHDEPPAPGEWLQVGAVAAVGLCLLLLSLLCCLCPVWVKVLPPVPAPKDSVAEFLVAISQEAGAGAGSQEAAESLSSDQEPASLQDSGL